jgi:hypothetical protein
MNEEMIKQRIREEILLKQFPDLADVAPQVRRDVPAEHQLRALRRTARVVTESDVKRLPLEHQFVYQRPQTEQCPFTQTVVVVTNERGDPQRIIYRK